jgi:L-lactate utilization protein LutB
MTDINTLPFYHTVQDLKEKDSLKILGSLETEKYFSTPSEDSINATVKALEAKGVKVHVVDTGAEATALVKGLIPAGASVMNPMSTTVAQIGLLDVIKTNPEWNNLHKAILAETDQAKVGALRRASFNADYWISGVNAITESGDIVTVDGTGS